MQWAKHAKTTAVPVYLERLCVQSACSHAAGGGNREVLEWLHNTGCPWDAWTARAAAAGGHLEVLTFLHSHGCLWNLLTCAFAARSGHRRVLQWAREQHCPWDWVTLAWAAESGHLAVLQWVRENDATGEVWSANRVRTWSHGPRKQEVLTWLDQLGAP